MTAYFFCPTLQITVLKSATWTAWRSEMLTINTKLHIWNIVAPYLEHFGMFFISPDHHVLPKSELIYKEAITKQARVAKSDAVRLWLSEDTLPSTTVPL